MYLPQNYKQKEWTLYAVVILRIIREKYFSCSKNPGIPYSNPILVAAKEKQIPIVTEVELAYRISEAPFVGITGLTVKRRRQC